MKNKDVNVLEKQRLINTKIFDKYFMERNVNIKVTKQREYRSTDFRNTRT